MPRVGNNDELLDLLRVAAAEKGGAGGASAMGGLSPSTPAPRTPASPAPRSALSTGATVSVIWFGLLIWIWICRSAKSLCHGLCRLLLEL